MQDLLLGLVILSPRVLVHVYIQVLVVTPATYPLSIALLAVELGLAP